MRTIAVQYIAQRNINIKKYNVRLSIVVQALVRRRKLKARIRFPILLQYMNQRYGFVDMILL